MTKTRKIIDELFMRMLLVLMIVGIGWMVVKTSYDIGYRTAQIQTMQTCEEEVLSRF